MPAPTVPDLVEALCRHALLEPAQLAELEPSFRQYPDAKSFLKDLVNKRKWLTQFQAQALWNRQDRDLVLGGYVLLEALGEGGMGQVFKARHRQLGIVRAIKRLRAELVGKDRKDRSLKRFRREMAAVGQLSHPNIVKAYDAGQEGDAHFLVMEYVEGVSLAKLVKEHGPVPVEQAIDYIRQVAAGLQHASETGLVHRDIKPSNLLVTPQGQIKILDLGLARFEDGSDSLVGGLTQVGTVLGTVDFIAPEQATDAKTADIRCDLYSLGCTFYFLVTGQIPFPGTSITDKVLKHRTENPVPIELIRPEVPDSVIAVIRKLMMKQPEERYATPADLIAALSSSALQAPPPTGVLEGAPLANSTASTTAKPASDPSWTPASSERPFAGLTANRAVPGRGRRPWWLWFGAAGLALVGVVIVVYLLKRA